MRTHRAHRRIQADESAIRHHLYICRIPRKPGIFWAGTDDGNLQVSTDDGTTWTNITSKFYDKNGKLMKNSRQGPFFPLTAGSPGSSLQPR